MAINKEEFYGKFDSLPENAQKKVEDLMNELLIDMHIEEADEDLTEEEMEELRMLEENIDSIEGTRIQDIDWDSED